MKKLMKFALAQTMILSLVLSTKVFASGSNVGRIYGMDRFETSINVSNNFSSGTVENVIVASGNNFPDALAGSVLSKKLNAPILLVDKSLSGSKDSINYIRNHLDIKGTVYVLGGQASISEEYVNYIRSLGFNNIKRLGGINRFDTNKVIVESMNAASKTPLVIVNGNNFPDALSISSIAGIKGYPIILSNQNSLPDEVKGKISEIQPSSVYIIGGQGSLKDSIISEVKALVPSIEDNKIIRIWGQDRYETSLNICKYFNLNTDTVVIANGENFPDALSGSALAAKLQAPILLTNGRDIGTQKSYIDTTNYKNKIILGGKGAVSDDVENILKAVEKKQFTITNKYEENGKYYIEGKYSRFVTDINEALEYEKRTGYDVVDEYEGQYYIPDDGFDMPISEIVKLEVSKDAELTKLYFSDNGDILLVKTDFTGLDIQVSDTFDLVIEDGVVVKMEQQYRP